MNAPATPSVSLVITCFNLGRTLDEALASVLDQTVQPADVVIVDDGSTDIYTRQVLSRLQREGHRVIRLANRGVSAARNTGVQLTSAPYVVLLDADDALQPSYLEKASTYLAEHSDTAFVSCGMECFGAVSAIWIPPPPTLVGGLSGNGVHISSMFRRELWVAVGGFDESLVGHEEVDFWTTALERGFVGHVLQEALLRYRVRYGSMSHRAAESPTHRRLMDAIYRKHRATLDAHAEALLLAKERFIVEQESHHAFLRARQQRLEKERLEIEKDISEAGIALGALGKSPVEFGALRRTSPISPVWGLDRGAPLDRHYIEGFLAAHSHAIRGRVLEVRDSGYTLKFGGCRVTTGEVLDLDPLNSQATIVADLTDAHNVPSDSFDCFILTQTLGVIYEVRRAIAEACRLLKPGGVLLCTVAASGRIGYEENQGLDGDCWRFTEASIRRLFAEVFPIESFTVEGFGNVLASTAFLYGLASHELTPTELDLKDPFFPVVYGIHAVKPQRSVATPGGPPVTTEAAQGPRADLILMYHRVSDHQTVPGLGVTPETFRDHMAHVRRSGYAVVSLRELWGQHRLQQSGLRLAITFDDGYAETARVCVPILQEFSFAATFFIVSGALEESAEFWWEVLHRVFTPGRRLPPMLSVRMPECPIELRTTSDDERQKAHETLSQAFYGLSLDVRDRLLRKILDWSGAETRGLDAARPITAADLLGLSRVPDMTVGCHTQNHLWLPSLNSGDRRREIEGGKARLEGLLGQPVTSFAYPYGALDADCVAEVKSAGFELAVTSEARRVLHTDDPFQLPRVDVGGRTAESFAGVLRVTSRDNPANAEANRP